MIDKNIHQDSFILKLLLTNECNLNCSDCLNDFQMKPIMGFLTHMHKLVFDSMVNGYLRLISLTNIKPEIYLSGGEPTISPNFISFIRALSNITSCKVVINTNGYWPRTCQILDWNRLRTVEMNFETELHDIVSLRSHINFHFGIYSESDILLKRILKYKGSMQTFLKDETATRKLIKFYSGHGFKIKIFDNFFKPDFDNYRRFIDSIVKEYPDQKFEFRHTGIQTNRSGECPNRTKTCCTLKGLWVRPEGKVSPCPLSNYDDLDLQIYQDPEATYNYGTTECLNHLIKAYNFFQVEENKICYQKNEFKLFKI